MSFLPNSTKKPQRAKPRIELAPDQPLTTQGRPRARVYVACLQCRTRKIRCDGARPSCHNCTRRAKSTDPCTFDPAPKRRGPDKTPGARQRLAHEARHDGDADPVESRHHRRKKDDTPPLPAPSVPISPLVLDPHLADIPPFHPALAAFISSSSALTGSASLPSDPSPILPDSILYGMTTNQDPPGLISRPNLHLLPNSLIAATTTHAFVSPYQYPDTDTAEKSSNITYEPSLDFIRQTWWDSLLSMYSFSFPSLSLSVPMSQRQQAANQITSDLRFFLRSSNYWFSFINVPRFLSIYFDTEKRCRMQPSLLLASLAIAAFFQSSEAGFGKQGRQRALRLRDVAQGALEASFNAHWIDEELAQAAWLLALFEICAHPGHTSERCTSALVMLDTIIRTLSLTSIDMDDPASTRFRYRSIPSIVSASQSWPANLLLNAGVDNTHAPHPSQGCSCASRSLGQSWAAAREYTPLWTSSPAWDSSWTEAEIRKETCRRLCWSTLLLTAGYTTYAISENRKVVELFVMEPSNFALFFPGEALRTSDGYSGKDTIWSLNCRAALLWHGCLRMFNDPSVTKVQVARFGLDAWLEADVLEAALNSHRCDFERSFLFQGREYLFNVRMIVTHEFQRYAPLPSGDVTHLFQQKAKEWLTHQAVVAQRVVESLGSVTGHKSQPLLHRPFFVFWFMGQISRALSVWERDNSLTLALDVGTALFKPIDYLSASWPCAEQRNRSRRIRERLTAACQRAGRPLPPAGPLDSVIVSE